MDGEVNGAQQAGSQAQGGEPQAQQHDEQKVTAAAGGEGDGAGAAGGAEGGAAAQADEEYKAALAERDAKISALEAQIASAAKSAEAADSLAKQIEEIKAANEAERTGYELKLAGCRSVRAGRVLLAEHEGDMDALRKAEPWLFSGAGAEGEPGGVTGLEPAGASGGDDGEMARWRAIAGLE